MGLGGTLLEHSHRHSVTYTILLQCVTHLQRSPARPFSPTRHFRRFRVCGMIFCGWMGRGERNRASESVKGNRVSGSVKTETAPGGREPHSTAIPLCATPGGSTKLVRTWHSGDRSQNPEWIANDLHMTLPLHSVLENTDTRDLGFLVSDSCARPTKLDRPRDPVAVLTPHLSPA
jgi:hypothetical protein